MGKHKPGWGLEGNPRDTLDNQRGPVTFGSCGTLLGTCKAVGVPRRGPWRKGTRHYLWETVRPGQLG